MSALALVASAALPLVAAEAAPRNLRVKKSASIPFGGGGIGAFTPAAADPGRVAAMSASGLSATGFRFTPAAGPGNRRGVTVAVRARTARPDTARVAALGTSAVLPTAYNLGVSIGWKRFALSGDVARMDAGLLPLGREAVDLGLSYSGKQWSTRVQVGADRATDQRSLIGPDQSYSVDLGGSYALTRNLELSGGVRYKRERDRTDYIFDDQRDSQAVYVGTAFRF
ncbi:hypothetical protein [Sphingomonas jatrophae]|uniref:hypothetical protein n=1 Tax=Sphingomonas jatrophae TaxID=1166337 RepID=UPI001F60778A|nr:hypothetical protein [Sphingomonas jatrophae]